MQIIAPDKNKMTVSQKQTYLKRMHMCKKNLLLIHSEQLELKAYADENRHWIMPPCISIYKIHTFPRQDFFTAFASGPSGEFK